jgi:hypothetical protein
MIGTLTIDTLNRLLPHESACKLNLLGDEEGPCSCTQPARVARAFADHLRSGSKIRFAEERQPYTVQALAINLVDSSVRYAICTKPFNPKKSVLYTIVDFVKLIRGTENLIFCAGFESKKRCEEAALRLITGETEISRRNCIPLEIVETWLPRPVGWRNVDGEWIPNPKPRKAKAFVANAPCDISAHPLIKQSYDVSHAIERCAASEACTAAVIKSSALTQSLANHFAQRPATVKLVEDVQVNELRIYENGENAHLTVTLDTDLANFIKRMVAAPAPIVCDSYGRRK